MKQLKTEEELLNEMFKDFPGTRLLIRQMIDDIYECIDRIQDKIIYLTQEQLEVIEEEDYKEQLVQEEFSYENL